MARNPGSTGSNGSSKPLSQYDKGYRDGYLEGLNECGPLAGFTQWYSRRGKTKKLGEMKTKERQAAVAQALAEYEAEGRGAKQRLLKNPSAQVHKKNAAAYLREADDALWEVKPSRSKEANFKSAMRALKNAQAAAIESSSVDAEVMARAIKTRIEAENEIRKLCGVKNPSEAGSAALGGIAGGLLLGPIGAAAGAYGGVKLKKSAAGKKAARSRARSTSKKRKKNPTVGRLVSSALK